MSRIPRYRWFVIGPIILIILGLVLIFITRIIPMTKTADHHTNGTPTQLGSTPHATNVATQPAGDNQPLQLSSDPYTNSTSQHKTEVEPGSYSYGSTIVAAFQAGRFVDHGSSNIGWATSTDGGSSWQHGFLPSTTKLVGGAYDRITDPAVAYDAAHNTWMIATVVSLETPGNFIAPAILVSLSTNDGITWNKPITVADTGSRGGLDKDWIVCDNTRTSRFYGNCYVEWDDYNRNNLIQMSTSKDGGRTWGEARSTVDHTSGFSGYPLVQPDGTVLVPLSNADQTAIMLFTSTDGGASWGRPITITAVTSFSKHAYFRDNILLTAQIDSTGRVYLVWVDCRFEQNCNGNDLVTTASTNGITWSPIRRIPLASIGSGINYYVAALGVDRDTSGPAVHLGLAFYYYSATCFNNCKLSIGFVSSINGGVTWSTKSQLAAPMPADWIAAGNNKVGDYIAVSFSGGKAFPVFAAATAPSGGHLDEAIYTVKRGLQLF